ncbi:MAG: 3-deoxy-manno-octulosonate cytidylyltransferase [Desulfobacteraceae bacterium]|nr:MAG: 3-deoxy-manno-octulosonate cytidylyltransferase [Desulfobacteraceae bacterium]
MKTIAFIPARYHSTRLPAKPLALIGGLPMIQRVYQCALACPQLDAVYVATDDERIAKCVQGFSGRFIMTSVDHASGTDRIAEAAAKVGCAPDDLIVNIQGDQPTFPPSVIGDMIKPLLADPNIPMGTLKHRIADPAEVTNLNHVKVVTDKHDFALYFSRSPIPYYREKSDEYFYYKHLGMYAYRLHFLKTFTSLPVSTLESAEKLEQLRALENGFKIKVVATAFDSIEVDTPGDIAKVEAWLQRSTTVPK